MHSGYYYAFTLYSKREFVLYLATPPSPLCFMQLPIKYIHIYVERVVHISIVCLALYNIRQTFESNVNEQFSGMAKVSNKP